MIEWLIELNLRPEFLTFLLALLPVVELRGAIPIALGVFDLGIVSAFAWAWFGSIIPGIILVYGLGFISDTLSRYSSFFKKFFTWWFERTHRRFWERFQKLGSLALILFVAIPLPVTGVWTGSVAAFLFGVKKPKAVLLIAVGSFIAGIIVSLIYIGALSFFEFLI